jgi:hypothetical protein
MTPLPNTDCWAFPHLAHAIVSALSLVVFVSQGSLMIAAEVGQGKGGMTCFTYMTAAAAGVKGIQAEEALSTGAR